MSVDFWHAGLDSSEDTLNYANGNAHNVLKMVGLPTDNGLYGTLKAGDIPGVLQRLMLAINKPEARAHTVYDGFDSRAFPHGKIVHNADTGLPTITRGCRIIDMGNTDAATLRRLTGLRTFLAAAYEGGHDVHWG